MAALQCATVTYKQEIKMICLFILIAVASVSADWNIFRSFFSAPVQQPKLRSQKFKVPLVRVDGLKFANEPADSRFPSDLNCKIIYHRVVINREQDDEGFDEVNYRIEIEAISVDDNFLGRIFLLHEMQLKNYESIEQAKAAAQEVAPLGSVEKCFPEVISAAASEI